MTGSPHNAVRSPIRDNHMTQGSENDFPRTALDGEGRTGPGMRQHGAQFYDTPVHQM